MMQQKETRLKTLNLLLMTSSYFKEFKHVCVILLLYCFLHNVMCVHT